MKLTLTQDDLRALMCAPPYAGNELLALALQFPRSPKLEDPETIHYFLSYEEILRPLRDRPINLLEMGVFKGDSLRLWQAYFPKARVCGIDIDVRPETEGLRVFAGDQKDAAFLAAVVREAGPFDVIIDDGSHMMADQIASLQYLFPHGLAADGLYIVEDLATSYWTHWGGGVDKTDTTIAWLKGLVDTVNYRAHKGGRRGYRGEYARIRARDELELDAFDEHLTSLSFVRSLCVLRKGDNRSLDAFDVAALHDQQQPVPVASR